MHSFDPQKLCRRDVCLLLRMYMQDRNTAETKYSDNFEPVRVSQGLRGPAADVKSVDGNFACRLTLSLYALEWGLSHPSIFALLQCLCPKRHSRKI